MRYVHHNRALECGVMKTLLLLSLASFATAQNPDASSMPNRCPTNPALGDVIAKPSWNGWGNGTSNSRYNGAGAELDALQASRLKLKWAFGFPGAKAVYGQPSVAAGRVFVGVDTGFVYSIDARTGCVYWSFQAGGAVRSAVSIGPGRHAGRYLSYFRGLNGNAYQL